MRIVTLLVVAACGAPPHPPIENRGTSKPLPTTTTIGGVHFRNDFVAAPGTATGTIRGDALDDHEEPMIGMTVVATSPALVGEQVVISDEHGKFEIVGLPPGTYTTTYYYNDQTHSHPGVAVRPAEITVEHVTSWPTGASESHGKGDPCAF